ncbi:hypothetical protein FPS98_01815 [Brevibacillus brevis]|uniref:RHS repeat-associated core domain-containing protein n=2 Tax=Brevibacillus brevis TaxID=1393 RepID=A0A517I1N7_BREBE|nr:hypothetical protein FPS98_01815 [Brevibacillus brevis]
MRMDKPFSCRSRETVKFYFSLYSFSLGGKMRGRYYHPGLKRFLNRDVLQGDMTDGQTFNRFTYVNGDPIGFIDPLGLMKCKDQPLALPAPKSAKERRKSPGTVTGGHKLTNPEKMMRGTHGNVGIIPKEIADKLRGQQFDTFDDFREAFWKTVADSSYAKEFSRSNIGKMKKGKKEKLQ